MSSPVPRILVVDDEDLLRWSICERLGESGYEVLEAGDGAQARSLMPQSIDLALFDIKLPDTDGLTLGEEIRRHHPDVPVIFMTAYQTGESMDRARRLRAYEYLTKPFDFDGLLETVARALGRTMDSRP